jgi:ADP-ribose pyrophosphatase YjhB (NUDIX family)
MYKVFFNDRKLFLTDNFAKHFQVKQGLFYKYRDLEDLKELISFYNQLKKIDSLYIFHTDIEELRDVFRECFIPIYAAGGLVRNQKNEYLLIFRRGKWDLPKGKLDADESFMEAAVREVQEECGISDISITRQLLSTYHTYPFQDGLALKKTSWFEMMYRGSETPVPQTEEDIQEVRWVTEEQLASYLPDSYATVVDVFTYLGI